MAPVPTVEIPAYPVRRRLRLRERGSSCPDEKVKVVRHERPGIDDEGSFPGPRPQASPRTGHDRGRPGISPRRSIPPRHDVVQHPGASSRACLRHAPTLAYVAQFGNVPDGVPDGVLMGYVWKRAARRDSGRHSGTLMHLVHSVRLQSTRSLPLSIVKGFALKCINVPECSQSVRGPAGSPSGKAPSRPSPASPLHRPKRAAPLRNSSTTTYSSASAFPARLGEEISGIIGRELM